MQYVEAFERMGYSVPAPRQDWTAESDTGIASPSGGLSLAFVTESLGSTACPKAAISPAGSTMHSRRAATPFRCIKMHQCMGAGNCPEAPSLRGPKASSIGASKPTWKARGRGGGKSAFWGVAGPQASGWWSIAAGGAR